jgi:hypothetical protein
MENTNIEIITNELALILKNNNHCLPIQASIEWDKSLFKQTIDKIIEDYKSRLTNDNYDVKKEIASINNICNEVTEIRIAITKHLTENVMIFENEIKSELNRLLAIKDVLKLEFEEHEKTRVAEKFSIIESYFDAVKVDCFLSDNDISELKKSLFENQKRWSLKGVKIQSIKEEIDNAVNVYKQQQENQRLRNENIALLVESLNAEYGYNLLPDVFSNYENEAIRKYYQRLKDVADEKIAKENQLKVMQQQAQQIQQPIQQQVKQEIKQEVKQETKPENSTNEKLGVYLISCNIKHNNDLFSLKEIVELARQKNVFLKLTKEQ